MNQNPVFSEKEIQILCLMRDDKTTKEIADVMDLSPRTIEHIKDVMRVKAGVKHAHALVLYAVKNSIIDLWSEEDLENYSNIAENKQHEILN